MPLVMVGREAPGIVPGPMWVDPSRVLIMSVDESDVRVDADADDAIPVHLVLDARSPEMAHLQVEVRGWSNVERLAEQLGRPIPLIRGLISGMGPEQDFPDGPSGGPGVF